MSATAAPVKRVPLICSGHSRPVPDFSYSANTEDGFFIISACLDGKPMLRKGENGDWIGTFMGHKGAVWSAHLNHSATLVATASADYSVKLWDAISGEEKFNFPHNKIVKTTHFNANDKILTGGMDKILRIYDANKPSADPIYLEGHTQGIKVAQWINTNVIASSCGDNQLHIWDIRTGKEEKTETVKSPIVGIELCLDGKTLCTVGGKEAILWNLETLTEVGRVPASVEVNSGSLSKDGKTMVFAGQDFWVHLVDVSSGKEIDVLKGHHGPVHCVRWAPDDVTFASSAEDGTIRIWVPTTYKDTLSSAPVAPSTTQQ